MWWPVLHVASLCSQALRWLEWGWSLLVSSSLELVGQTNLAKLTNSQSQTSHSEASLLPSPLFSPRRAHGQSRHSGLGMFSPSCPTPRRAST